MLAATLYAMAVSTVSCLAVTMNVRAEATAPAATAAATYAEEHTSTRNIVATAEDLLNTVTTPSLTADTEPARMVITRPVATAENTTAMAESTLFATVVAALSATEKTTVCVRRADGIYVAEITPCLSADTRLATAEVTTRVTFAVNISA